MKKLLFLAIMISAFACGDGSKSQNENDSGVNTEQNNDRNTDETVSPDTTTTNTQGDTTSVGGQQ